MKGRDGRGMGAGHLMRKKIKLVLRMTKESKKRGGHIQVHLQARQKPKTKNQKASTKSPSPKPLLSPQCDVP